MTDGDGHRTLRIGRAWGGRVSEVINPDACAGYAQLVLCHHECPDGSGYPRHLRAERIPLGAAILRVADVFAALVEPRPYKSRLTPREAIARMQLLDGKLDSPCLAALEHLASDDAVALVIGEA